MANKFETATNNYGNNFSNNNGNHYYTTYGHKYDDSAYVLAKFNGQVDPVAISSTKNGYPTNSVTTYGQGYIVEIKEHTHVDEYTQTNTLRWPSNINTKGKIEGTLSFSVDKTSVPASGGTVNIHMPDLKYTATRDTRGYRYVDVTLKPDVPSNPDTLDDDGTAFSNSTVESTTYVGENRQGFLNYREPKLDYVIYSSYGNKGDNPFYLHAKSMIYNALDAISVPSRIYDISSASDMAITYMHMYDNININYSYGYAPYHDEVKDSYLNEGVGWTHENTRVEVADNFLSTYPKMLTMSYKNTYWTISYDGVSDMPFTAAFEYNGTYRGVTSSTDIDNNLTSYDRSTVLHNFFSGIANSSTTPSYVATSYTISQPKATLTPSYCWSLPETAGTGASNFDTKTGAKYVNITRGFENNYISYLGTTCFVDVAKQGHYMGYVSGNLDNTLATSATNRIITMDHGTSKEGTIGNLKWTDCENRTERFFNIRVSTKYDNCRNQNITSITNEYVSGDKRKPEVTLKCRQLPAHWNHPGIQIGIKSTRYVIPSDSRFDNVNPTIGISTTLGWEGGTSITYFSAGLYDGTNSFYWTISPHTHHLISTVDNNNSKLLLRIYMPTISTPYIKSTVGGSISASASTTYVGPTKSDITITPTWNLWYTRGYDKGFDVAEWKYSFVNVQGYNDDPNNHGGDGMDCSGVTGFNDFIVHLNKCEDFNYRYPSITLTATTSNSTFSLDKTTNEAGSEYSLADGAKSTGFTVSVPDNPKTGSTWYGAVTTEPTETISGIISVSPGTLMNSASRSTTISFSNSFDGDLTSGSITNPVNITITQGPDKWGGDNFYYCVDVATDGTHEHALITSFLGLRVQYKYKTFTNPSKIPIGNNYTNNTYDIGTLRKKHQLEIIGIGSIKSKDYSTTAEKSSYSVNYTGYPDEEDEDDFTYVTVAHLYCSNYDSIGVTEGPNGTSGRVLKTWTVTPIATDYKVQYQLNNGAWQDGMSLRIGTNYGSTTAASCVSNTKTGDDVKSGAFNYTPEKYSGSTTKYHKFKVRVVDNTDPAGTAFENPTQYTITQSGVDATVTSRTFTFKTGGIRCTTSTPSSVSGNTAQNNVGSFTVTPNSDPFYNYTSYTNGMVVNSFKINTFKQGITKDDSLSATHTGNVDFQSGTSIDFWFGIAGSTSDYITWSRTGSVKYKFYYDYWVQCYNSSNTMVSGKESGTLESSEITSTPSSNATNYYKRRLVDGSWSTSLTRQITSTGTYSVTGGWVTESGSEYSTSRRDTFTITVRTYTVETEYRYQIPPNTGKMSLSFTNSSNQSISSPVQLESTAGSYRVYANGPAVNIQVSSRTYRHFNTGADESYSDWSEWTDTGARAYTISPSYADFNPSEGNSETKNFTLSVRTNYNGYNVTTNGASSDSQSFTVSKKNGDVTEYRTYCTMTVTNATITAFDTSGTTSCTFSTDIQYRVTNNGSVITDWTSTGNADTSVTINATSKKLTPSTMGSSASTYSTTTFTFTLSGGTYNKVGTTSVNGCVYKYGKTYYNS